MSSLHESAVTQQLFAVLNRFDETESSFKVFFFSFCKTNGPKLSGGRSQSFKSGAGSPAS